MQTVNSLPLPVINLTASNKKSLCSEHWGKTVLTVNERSIRSIYDYSVNLQTMSFDDTLFKLRMNISFFVFSNSTSFSLSQYSDVVDLAIPKQTS